MSLLRAISFSAVLLLLSADLQGSDQEKSLEVRWGELNDLIGVKLVTLQLAEGARVEGRIRSVNAASLDFNVKNSSSLTDYPKGEAQIPRDAVSRIEVRGLKENKGIRVAATVGTFVGTMMGSMVAIAGTEAGEPGDKYYGSYAASIAISTGVAILVNRALRPKDVTFIKILPDSPGARMPKPTDKEESTYTTASEEVSIPPLFEESSSERFRRQARRAVMRQDLPLDLRRLHVQGAQTSFGQPGNAVE
ncbi:MAG: hypothetical protein OXI69_17595 [Acidobacteriota bacterium]|nr:hypothetical protein [Acidobacteriota bacterium]